MEFTSEMIMKLNIAEKNLLNELYRKCLGTTMEERVQEQKRNEWKWTTPGPAAIKHPRVVLNPLPMAEIIPRVELPMVEQASWVGRG